jgi:hypothetical protein
LYFFLKEENCTFPWKERTVLFPERENRTFSWRKRIVLFLERRELLFLKGESCTFSWRKGIVLFPYIKWTEWPNQTVLLPMRILH